ncbi:MAG: hypothetical protein U0031_12565 [Thermomicrobiales bacterium]
MDSNRFDRLTRLLARPASRRRTLLGLVAGVWSGLTVQDPTSSTAGGPLGAAPAAAAPAQSCALQRYTNSRLNFDDARSKVSKQRPDADMVDVDFYPALDIVNACAARPDINVVVRVTSAYRNDNTQKGTGSVGGQTSPHTAGHAIDFSVQYDPANPKKVCGWTEKSHSGCLGTDPPTKQNPPTPKNRDYAVDPLNWSDGNGHGVLVPGDPGATQRVQAFIQCVEQGGLRWGGRFKPRFDKKGNPVGNGYGKQQGFDPLHFDDDIGTGQEFRDRKKAVTDASDFLHNQSGPPAGRDTCPKGQSCNVSTGKCEKRGECDPPCKGCTTCRDGRCEANCPGGRECCGGSCLDPCGDKVRNPDSCRCECAPISCGDGKEQDAETCQCRCRRSGCPGAQALNPDTCACECPPVSCEQGKDQNPDTCDCECAPISCADGMAQDPRTCQCECTSTDCGSKVLNPDTCQCECAPVSCADGKDQNRDTCQCECAPISCAAGQAQDPETCSCECRHGCADGKVQDPETCACACAPVSCADGKEQNPETCECDCIPISCGDKILDPETCGCECAPVSCAEGKDQNPETCACECAPISCADGQDQNPETCQCECAPISCADGKSQDPDGCDCRCNQSCSGAQVQDPETCACECQVSCPGNQTPQGDECACACPPATCTGNEVQDAETCACVCPMSCPEGQAPLPGSCECPCAVSCPGTKIPDPETCMCVCPSGTTDCNGDCLASGQCCTDGDCGGACHTCVNHICQAKTCGECQVCSDGACVAKPPEAGSCSNSNASCFTTPGRCGANNGCYCRRAAAGSGKCGNLCVGFLYACRQSCDECLSGYECIDMGCCQVNGKGVACVQRCANP